MQTFTIRSDNVYQDMIKLYRKRTVKTSFISLRFEGEDAIGDGILRISSESLRITHRWKADSNIALHEKNIFIKMLYGS